MSRNNGKNLPEPKWPERTKQANITAHASHAAKLMGWKENGALAKEAGITKKDLWNMLAEELGATEQKATVPRGREEFVYSKPMAALKVRQAARQDAMSKLGMDYPRKLQIGLDADSDIFIQTVIAALPPAYQEPVLQEIMGRLQALEGKRT